MKNIENVINDIILSNQISNSDIIVLKGFPLDIILEVAKDRFLGNRSFINNNVIDFESLENNRKIIVTDLLSGIESYRFLTYEAFLTINGQITDLVNGTNRFYIIENNLLDFYPSTTNEVLPDIEENIDKGIDFEDSSLSNKYYVNSKIINDNVFVQYYLIEDHDNIITINLLKSQQWDFYKLDNIKEDLLSHDSIIYKYNDNQFTIKKLSFLFDTYNDVDIYIDSSIQGNILAIKEIGLLIDLFEKRDISYNIYNIEYNLGVSSRPELNELLNKYWNSNEFRTIEVYQNPDFGNHLKIISQSEVVENIIKQYEDGNLKKQVTSDIFLTAPTGAGKSLLFQMPAMYLADKYKAVTIIVSPLIALMKDQVIQLKEEKNYHQVAYINSEVSLNQRDEILEGIKNENISILYLSPELLLSYDIKYFIGDRIIGLLVIDEAHLVTTWGRDFRVDYWYLGYHIQKIRKYARDKNDNLLRFPLIALTATAPYNGPHDIVFETISSLQMNNTIKYISKIKREDITFDIRQSNISNNHEREKIILSAKRIEEYEILGDKTIIYCPWTRLVNALHLNAQAGKKIKVSKYFGTLNKDEKQQAYESFKSGQTKSMIATKAFGMGIDISDITRVYHLAPSGNLSDYIQEVGRLARDKKLRGVASIDFTPKDLKFIKVLFGLSSIKNWQLRAMIEKINKIYQTENRRNLLVSVDDFGHIFSMDDDNIDQKVKSGLMLLEKDLEQKYKGIKVLIGRPKSLFTRVYGCVKASEYNIIKLKYEDAINEISYKKLNEKDFKLVSIDLDQVWKKEFSSKSFPVIKRDFYTQDLFSNIKVVPKIKIKITLHEDFESVRQKIFEYFNQINNALSELALKGFFNKSQFIKALYTRFKDQLFCKRLADFILTIYGNRPNTLESTLRVNEAINSNIFIQARRNGTDIQYRLIDRAISKVSSNTIRDITDFFNQTNCAIRYVSPDSTFKQKYINTAQIIEIFNLGLYEINGGENPMIYLRINDPVKINTLSYDLNYKNTILENIKHRYELSILKMEDFFMSKMNNDERWDYVEDYFLGK